MSKYILYIMVEGIFSKYIKNLLIIFKNRKFEHYFIIMKENKIY